MKNRTLIIVDPQIDFISGTLSTKNGKKAIDLLVEYIKEPDINFYDSIIITADLHPKNHCSFKEFGGPFEPHCVKGTQGCKVYPDLESILISLRSEGIPLIALIKGNESDKEEFSVLQNEISGKILKCFIVDNNIEMIDVCGIATDYCVYETVKDLHENFPNTRISVLTDFCAAVDESDKKLFNYCETNKNVQLI